MIKVTLLRKAISKGRQSLYLDFYPPILNPKTGKLTRRYFLNLHILKNPQTTDEKDTNRQNLMLAKQIRLKRENELNKPEVYTEFEKEQLRIKALGERSFIKYFRKLTNSRKGNNHDNWLASLYYLEAFTGGELKFSDLTEKFCNDYREYLLTTPSRRSSKRKLSQNTASSYFNKFKAVLKQAYKDELLRTDLNSKIPHIKQEETQRKFLTLEELNLLASTKCSYPMLKEAALFSALTGLRFSDIEKLVWGELENIKGQGYFINFKQRKTKGVEFLPISVQAYELLGPPKGPKDRVFDGLYYSPLINYHILKWLTKAGITKDITFHCFRHTYATLQLSAGTDIYTVSKMLGHRDVKTTQLYAKIVNQTKRDAADRIKLDL